MSPHLLLNTSAASVVASRPSIIERLPDEVQRMVYSLLDYQSLIYLSTMNRHFHRAIDPQAMADPVDKTYFVMKAVKDFPQHRPNEKGHEFRPGNFECYICFRVRSPDHFDMYQPLSVHVDLQGQIVRARAPHHTDREVMLRRFCIDCGVKEGLHAPFHCLVTRTGRDLWPGCLRCPDCGGDCPFDLEERLEPDFLQGKRARGQLHTGASAA
ncbi:hypothetical protein B0I35DRAFT_455132 [Stachybotrys elegans]|uniref:F-box domain-containing protein n=1 Tax=Stachybotrys elegans TaxID=80388 RepID=A0A8K0SB78_9HYPO|nr:hypothetical protein B0I35DRAFT_455132 [Stachybotrys elegans]